MSVPYELQYLVAGGEELKDYLLSDEVFWPVPARPTVGRRAFPKLTIGNLLLSRQKLEGWSKSRQMTSTEQTAYARLSREIDAMSHKWTVAWEGKCQREYDSRFKQWANYLNDLVKGLEAQAPYYFSEVRTRVLLALLAAQIPGEPQPDLLPLDAVLKGFLNPGAFIWDEELEGVFPSDAFWFLYGEIVTEVG